MSRQEVPTDHVFDTENEAWKYITDHYSVEKNYIMRNARKAGKKVSVGVKKQGRKFLIVIYIG